MLFLVDECTGPAVARWLRTNNYDVFSVFDEARGLDDNAVLQRAFAEERILITNDKDFGEKVFRERLPHRGVILLRLADERAANKILALDRVISGFADRLADHFVVVTENAIRISDR
jgi:predicted nuclease of predicted toxin-antitoxin system